MNDSQKPPRSSKKRPFRLLKEWGALVISTVLVLEIGLQVFAALGWLPGLNIASYVPYGRIYFTKEGFGNSLNNRHGWFHPRSDFADEAVRVAVIGDSFVRAIHVDRSHTVAARLDQLLEDSLDSAGVLSFGLSASGPPEYLELLDFAIENHSPTDAIVCFYIGNDFRSCLEMVEASPESSLHQVLDENGDLQWDPRAQAFRRGFRENLKSRHLDPRAHWKQTIASHFFLYNVGQAIRWGLRARAMDAAQPTAAVETRDGWADLGLVSTGFETVPTEEGLLSRRVLRGYLKKYREFAEEHGIEIAFVSIPHFSARFYTEQSGRSWSTIFDEYDLLAPERYLEEATAELELRFLPLGREMHDRGFSVEEVQGLYLFEGKGHFSDEGHAFAAKAIYEEFFSVRATVR